MFDEVPAPSHPFPSYRWVLATFATYLATFLACIIFAYLRWSHPFTLRQEVIVVEFVIGAFLSAVFLATAKAAAAETNRNRMTTFTVSLLVVQFVLQILQ
jgi:hypothetical protein